MNGRSHHRLVQVPPGVQCFVGDEARRRRAHRGAVVAVFEGWDYEEIIPPLFDYADVFADAGARRARPTRSSGRDGSLLALRPDFTSLLAKIAAGRLADRRAPIRLYYSGEVLRYEPPKAGRQSELYQMGLEHLGGDAAPADAEVLAIAAECLERWASRGCVLALGHVGVFARPRRRLPASSAERSTLLRDARREQGRRGRARTRWQAQRRAGRRGGRARAPHRAWRAGSRCWTRRARAFARSPARRARRSTSCAAVADASPRPASGDRVAIDLGEVRGLDYYTGLVFRAYARGLGFEVGGGGRYDTLLGALRPAACPRSASCSASTAWPCCSSGRAARRPVRARCAAEADRGRGPRRAPARARAPRRAATRRVRFGNGGPAMSLTVALSKGKLLAGTEALFRARASPFPNGDGPPAGGGAGRPALPVREGHGRAHLRRVRRRRLRHRRARRAARGGQRRLRAARPAASAAAASWWRGRAGSGFEYRRRLHGARRHQVPAAWRPRTSWSAASRSRW